MAQDKNIVTEEEGETSAPETETVAADNSVAGDEAQPSDDPIQALEEKLTAAEEKAKDHHDRMLRMAAELENYKKRAIREQADLKKFATENLIRQLLGVVDNLERAIASANADNGGDQGVVDGVALTLAEVNKILEKHGVTAIEAQGQPFDPAFHQAMCAEESADQPPNTVIQEFQKGYLMHERLLRPAMVVVSKSASNGQPAEQSVDTQA